ncbi:type II 3-dehydroquinate dehydratase [Gulosibacter macacae]|uniref:3-dehydroquinate dehydratase n=1 Tax=Gulosibacter macacae TaxID=2488791 RepID=A0A3P3W2Q7_9MICO|nr:type II 3-dehydroquinate dehydratase [Gulosibacter macacae]RRJ88658.1 type II 3-dehydroquinate dehydratase [Gulosibacter macacae]
MTQRPRILVVNGPNLNTLGQREPEIYGHETLADVETRCRRRADQLGLDIDFMQSNHEGEIVDAIQQARGTAAGILINPAAYSHTSVAIHDALAFAELPTFEVHISQVHRREQFRHHSYVSHIADAVLAGAGTLGYELGLEWLAERVSDTN